MSGENERVNPLGMKSIMETARMPIAVQMKETVWKSITWDWIFSTWYEKGIVMASFLWAVYSIGKFLWGFF